MTKTPDIWMLHTTNPREGESQWGGCYIVEADAHNDAATMRKVTGLDWEVVPMVRADSLGKCLHQIAEPWKDHRTAALINDLRDCAKAYASTEQLRERIATIVAPLCDQLKAAERAQLQTAPQAVQPAVPQLKANCYSDDNGDYWRDCPDDCDFVEGLKVGDTYELQASIRAWPEIFRVTKAPDETSDDYEVELVSSDAPAHPAEGVPTSSDLRERLARLEAGCNAHTTPTVYEAIADSKAALDELDEARQRVGISLAATQPAAQGLDAKESDYQRGYRHGYNRRDDEVKGALV